MAFEKERRPCYKMFDEFARLATRAEYLRNLQKFAPSGKQTNWGTCVQEQRMRFQGENYSGRNPYWGYNLRRSDDFTCRVPAGMHELMALFHQAIEFEIDESERIKARRLSRADRPISGNYEPPQG